MFIQTYLKFVKTLPIGPFSQIRSHMWNIRDHVKTKKRLMPQLQTIQLSLYASTLNQIYTYCDRKWKVWE